MKRGKISVWLLTINRRIFLADESLAFNLSAALREILQSKGVGGFQNDFSRSFQITCQHPGFWPGYDICWIPEMNAIDFGAERGAVLS